MSLRVALLFPDLYEVGMSHLGLGLLYGILNREEEVWAERAYAPAPDLEAGRRLGGAPVPGGACALALTVFPGLSVGVILWQADDEFPAQVTFAVPSHLDRFWQLDAVLGLLVVVAEELLQAAMAVAG